MAQPAPSSPPFLAADTLLGLLFERMPVGIALFDRDLILQRCNPTWAEFVEKRGALPAGTRVAPGVSFFDLAPGNEEAFQPLIRHVLSGDAVRQDALRLVVCGRVSFWDVALVPLLSGDEVLGILHASVDATDRVLATREIERQNACLEALHDTALDIVGRLNVTELLEAIVERSLRLVDSLYGWVYLVADEGESIQVKVATGLFRRYIGLSLKKGEGLAGVIWQHGLPMAVDDYQTWPDRADYFADEPIGPGMGVPLKAGADVVGVIGLTRARGQPAFTAGELDLMSRFAQLASIALENARLHTSLQRQLEESRREAEQRAQAEEALRRSQAELRAIFAAMTDVILVLDRDGRYVEVAPTDPSLLYRPADRLIGKTLHDVFPADRASFFATQIREVLTSREPVTFEYPLSINEREVWFAATITPLNGDSVIWVARDITQGKRNERALRRRLGFERLVADISAEFVNLGPDQIDAGIEHALAAIGQFTRADRSYVFSYSDDALRVTSTHEWCAEGVGSQRERIQNQPLSLVPWFMQAIRQQPAVLVPCVADLPEDAAADRAEWEAQGILSLLGVPMIHQGSLIGILGLNAVSEPRVWDEDDQQVLQIVAGIIVNALQHKRAQAIAAGQRRFLELLATGGSFTETLHSLVRMIEEQLPGIQGLILLLDPDGLHLHVGAAASLPEDYLRTIEGLEIGPMVGSCGTACYRRERVIVEDIATDPRWEGLRALALRHDLRACWSEPVFAANGQVVGTFAMYYREPRGPSHVELQTIQTAAHLVGIAVQHEDAEKEIARAYQSLEQRVQERTHALAALNAIASTVTRSLDLQSILYDALDKTLDVTGMEMGLACRLATLEESRGVQANGRSRLIPLAQRGIWGARADPANPVPLSLPHLSLPLGAEPVVQDVASQRPSLYRELLLRQGVRLFISVPLLSKGEPLGAILLASSRLRPVTTEELSLLQAVGAQVAVAMENAGLYQDALHREAETERRRQVAERMREILASLNSNQPLEHILNDIVARASQILGTDAGVIRRIEVGRGLAVREIGYGMPPELDQEQAQLIAPTAGNAALADRRPVVIPDYTEYYRQQMVAMDPATREQYEVQAKHFAAHFRSALRLPLVARNQIYGELALFSRAPRNFSDEDTGVALAIADQAALAIENALLRQQAAEAAAITERARLARELHDSVTQSLYSMTLYAEAAARLLTTGEQARAAEYLRDLRDTSQEALREMRLLVFELRPPALEQVGLAGALQARLKAVESRGGLATAFHVEGAAPPGWLSPPEQQELFTIAQEALNNAFKHAHARRVSVALRYGQQAVSLTVSDDGAGFDPLMTQASGGMGLAGMAERADRIGARLVIASSPGNGTTVTVDVSQPQGDRADRSS